MATITGMTAEAMQAIASGMIIQAGFDSANHLILTKQDGTQTDAGIIAGANTVTAGLVKLATNTQALAGTDTTLAMTPANARALRSVTGAAETDPISVYPVGTSTMTVVGPGGWSLNNGYGLVVTNAGSSTQGSQTFYTNSGGTDLPLIWNRSYDSSVGGGGWTPWQQVGILVQLTAASFTESTTAANYPYGESRLHYASDNATGWSFTGMAGDVITYRNSDTGTTRQTFMQTGQEAGTNPPQMWIRAANASGTWTSWHSVVFYERIVNLPKAVATGFVNITPTAANTPTKLSITFPGGLFTTSPSVLVTANTSAPGTSVTGVAATAVTTSGCDLYLTRANTTPTGVWWLALAM